MTDSHTCTDSSGQPRVDMDDSEIGSISPLTTQPYQMLASRSIVTRPTTVALGAMKVSGWMSGL